MDSGTRLRIDDLLCELEKLAASSEFQEGWHLQIKHRERLDEIITERAACRDEDSLRRARKSLRRILAP